MAAQIAVSEPVAAALDDTGESPDVDLSRLSSRSVLGTVARKSAPHLIEASLIPLALFYLFLFVTNDVWTALLAALCWSYSALARRVLFGRKIPPILMLTSIGLTVRTIAAVGSGSTFVYFLQPIFGTVLVAGVFAASLFDRPLVGRLAVDFCPLTPEVAGRPGVLRLFRSLTILWAGINLVTAATTFTLLMSVSMASFVAAKALTGLVITASGVALTVSWSLKTARREGLLSAGAMGLALGMPL